MKPLEYYGANLASLSNYTKVMQVAKFTRILNMGSALCLAAAAFAQQDAKTIIQSNYDKVSALSVKRDKVNLAKLIRKNTSSQFEYIDMMRNSLDLPATVRQNTEQLSRIFKFNYNSNKIIDIRMKGNDLACKVKTEYDVLMYPDGKVRVTGMSVSEDIWTKTLMGWKIKRSMILKESTKMNGKPVK